MNQKATHRRPATHPYRGRVAALATMHRKEAAIAPPLMEIVGLQVVVATGVDTDALGTFAGDIPREGSITEVARRKARLGMAACNSNLGLASEGAYGPHPATPLISIGTEMLVFVDDALGIEISESLVTSEIVFETAIVFPGDDLAPFLARAGFPSHGLIARPNIPRDPSPIIKDILQKDVLDTAIEGLARFSADGAVCVSNDMRAHRNPTRMRCIGQLAQRLAERITSLCPACRMPGFGKVGIVAGLLCRDCGASTLSPRAETFGCGACAYTEIRPRADNKTSEDPMYCGLCNP